MEPMQPMSAQASQIDQAGDVLGRAFFDDPLVQYTVPQLSQRRRFLRIFQCYARYGYLYGEVTIMPSVIGAAVWIPPRHYNLTPARLLRIGVLQVPTLFRPRILYRSLAMLLRFDQHHTQDMPGDHWYLLALGVDPPFQRQGLGSSLLRPRLLDADRTGAICYLETTRAANVPFYTKLGFEVVRHNFIPHGGPPYWTMRRMPKRSIQLTA